MALPALRFTSEGLMRTGFLVPLLNEEQQQSFGEWWKNYPRRQAKLDAMRAWLQTEQLHTPLTEMIATLDAQKKTLDWLRDGGQYIPLPASYLRAGRFMDDVAIDMGANVNAKPWHESWSGIVAKGKELGIPDSSDAVAYRASVMRAAMKAA
jgi:hypothetical protein